MICFHTQILVAHWSYITENLETVDHNDQLLLYFVWSASTWLSEVENYCALSFHEGIKTSTIGCRHLHEIEPFSTSGPLLSFCEVVGSTSMFFKVQCTINVILSGVQCYSSSPQDPAASRSGCNTLPTSLQCPLKMFLKWSICSSAATFVLLLISFHSFTSILNKHLQLV